MERLSANGSYNTAYLGVFGYDAYLKDIDSKNKGMFVVSVDNNSPASLLGIKQGDIITKFNGKEVDSVLDLRLAIYSLNNGDQAKVEILRNGQYETKVANLCEHPYCYKCEKLNYEDFR